MAILASKVTCFVYNHKWPLNWLRKREGWREILRPFCNYLCCIEKSKWSKGRLASYGDISGDVAKAVKQTVLDERFWNNCNIIVRMVRSQPRLRLCRKGIKELFKNKRNLYADIIDQRWDKMLRKSLHASSYYLNLAFRYDKATFRDNPQIFMKGFIDNKVLQKYIKRYLFDIRVFQGPLLWPLLAPITWWKKMGIIGIDCNSLLILTMSNFEL